MHAVQDTGIDPTRSADRGIAPTPIDSGFLRPQEVAMAPEGELVPIGEAARRAGCSQATLRRLVRAGELPAFTRRLDRRARLVRVDDIEGLRAPRRLEPREVPPMVG